MATDRREFLSSMVGAGLVIGGKTGSREDGKHPPPSRPPALQSATWDTSWTSKVTGKHRAVFDAPEVSDGLPLIRTLVWIRDYREVYGVQASEMSAVVVLRHNAIWMIMNDEFWDHHDVGKLTKINDPKTGKPIKRNPFLGPTPFGGLPPALADHVLTKVLGTAAVLACNLAFQDVVDRMKDDTGGDAAKARSMALHHVVPGIVLQPSGVFAVTRAQEEGCQYMLAS